jgi:predicted ester cyclase
VRRYIEEVVNHRDLDAIEEVLAPDYLNHAAVAEHQHGIAGAKHILDWLIGAFPDFRFEIEDIVAEGDMVAVRATATGTHEGRELWGIQPTGRRFAVQQVHWMRVADGRLAEHWAVRDDLGMMRQLGVNDA